MKLSKLLQARRALSAHTNEPIPTMLAYKILKFIKASDTEGAFYDAKIKEIIDKYGKRDEDGNIELVNGCPRIAPDLIEECQRAIKELEETEVETPSVSFHIQELTPINFSVTELFSLDEIIIEEG